MYIILQYGPLWGMLDVDAGTIRELEEKEINRISDHFGNLLGNGALNVFQLQKINPNKLMKMPSTGYVIVRVGSMWTIYEGGKVAPRILEDKTVGELSEIFPKMADQQMLNAVAVDTFNPVKLLNLISKPKSSTSPPASSSKNTAQEKELQIPPPLKNTG